MGRQSFRIYEIHESQREKDAMEDRFLEAEPQKEKKDGHEEGGNEDADFLHSDGKEKSKDDTGKERTEKITEFLSFRHEKRKWNGDDATKKGIGKHNQGLEGCLVATGPEKEEANGQEEDKKGGDEHHQGFSILFCFLHNVFTFIHWIL